MFKFKAADIDDVLKINSIVNKKFPPTAIYVEGILNGEIFSVCPFVLGDNIAEIIDLVNISAVSDELLMANLKSSLNYIDLFGIKNVTCNNKDIEKFLLRAGFKNDKDIYIINLEGYFEAGCNHTN